MEVPSCVRNSPCRLCGHTATLNCSISELRNCEKVEVPSCVRYSPCCLCGHTATLNCSISELRNCEKVEVPSCVRNSPCCLGGHTATLNCSISELRNCEKVEVAVLSSPVPNWIDWIDDHLYSAILRSLEQTHCARIWFYMSD